MFSFVAFPIAKMDVIFIFVLLLLPCMCYDYDEENSYFPRKLLKSPYVRKRGNGYGELYKYGRPNYRSLSEWLRNKKDKPKKWKKSKNTPPDGDGSTVYTRLPKNPTLTKTVFTTLRTKQNQATPTSQNNYPWIAQVVHSRDKNEPYICTAACIEERIFVTAARCIVQALVVFTTVIYQDARLQSIAFVAPTKPTKTMFDDIGFIIVSKTNLQWKTVNVFDKNDNKLFTRSDNNFFWFANMINSSNVYTSEIEGKVIGYVNQKLYEAKAYTSPYFCQHFYNTDIVLTKDFRSDNYFVPCYHTCTLEEGYNKSACKTHLAGEGHIMIEKKTSKLIGIATWAGYCDLNINLPVGMAIPNSENFLEDRQCARKIRDAPVNSKTFANLCK